MFLSALTLAAALSGAPAIPTATPFALAPKITGQRSAFECRQRAALARGEAIARGRPLSTLPPGLLQHTVIRLVDGCPVSTQVRQGAR